MRRKRKTTNQTTAKVEGNARRAKRSISGLSIKLAMAYSTTAANTYAMQSDIFEKGLAACQGQFTYLMRTGPIYQLP